MKWGRDSLSKATLGIHSVLRVKSRQERSDPDGDGGQFPEAEGNANPGHASFLQEQENLALGKSQTDLLCLYLEPCLLNPEAFRNFPEAT